jgi:restriction endonuclease S subunit
VPATFLAEHNIPVPTIEEQRRIVHTLSECLTRIEEIAGLQFQMEKEAKSVLSAALNDFDRSSKCPRVVLNELLLDSQNGRSIRSTGESGNGRVLTLSAVKNVLLDASLAKSVDIDNSTSEKNRIMAGDVFVSRSNTRGLVGLSAWAPHDCPVGTIFPDLLIKLTPDRRRVAPLYLAYALRIPSVREQIRARAKGTSQSMVKISGTSLRTISIPLPPLEEQAVITETLNRIRESVIEFGHQLGPSTPAALQQSMFTKAFAGEL